MPGVFLVKHRHGDLIYDIMPGDKCPCHGLDDNTCPSGHRRVRKVRTMGNEGPFVVRTAAQAAAYVRDHVYHIQAGQTAIPATEIEVVGENFAESSVGVVSPLVQELNKEKK